MCTMPTFVMTPIAGFARPASCPISPGRCMPISRTSTAPMPDGISVFRSPTAAAAPRAIASLTNSAPSISWPRSAKKTPPVFTSRESVWKVENVSPTWVPPTSPPPVASRISRRLSFMPLQSEPFLLYGPTNTKWSGNPDSLRASPGAAPRATGRDQSKPRGGSAGEIRRSHPRCLGLVWCDVPADDERLRDLLPDRLGGDVAVGQGPVILAPWVVRLAHDDQHREPRLLGGQESDE